MVLIQKFVELPNRIRIPYLEQGDPKGSALVMLHGVADSCRAFEPILAYLPKHIHSFAMTLRGHGDASRPDSGYSTDDFAEDLVMFMDELDLEKAIILGASSGGFPARRFAIKYPERIMGLVLLGSPSSLRDKPFVQDLWDSVISKLTDPVDPKFVEDFSQNIISPRIPKELLEMMLEENLKVTAQVWQGVIKGILEEEFPGNLGKIRAETLIIWGDKDTVVARGDMDDLMQAIKHSRLSIHAGTGHLLYWEEPETIASDIAEFMRELSADNK